MAVWVENGSYSAEVPDLPGVITEADSIEELSDEDYQDCTWMLVDIDMSKLSDKTERLNICLPSRALRRLDLLAAKAGESRSGFLAKTIYSLNG